MRKLCSRWMPRLLTIDQKHIRVTTSEQNLACFNRNPKEFLLQFVAVDESAPKHPNMQQSTGKVIASVFWEVDLYQLP